MAIPDLTDGVLPEGVHVCTIDEVEDRFAYFGTEQRSQLTNKLREFIQEAKSVGFVAAVVIDGSYVTAKKNPNDIDIIVALRPDFDLKVEMRPFEYNVCSKRMVRRLYKFDVFVFADGSEGYDEWVAYFSRIRQDDPDQKTSRTNKGLLRIEL